MKSLYALICRLMFIAAALVVAAAAAVIAVRFTVVAIIVVAAIWYRRRNHWGGASTHGTAGFATIAELERAGMLDAGDGKSLIVGRVGDFSDPITKPQAFRALLSPITPSELAVEIAAAAFLRSRRLSRRFVRVHDYVHLAAVSRAGGGKGIGIVEPVLKSYTESMFILDPKGELAKKCAGVRSKMGHTIIKLEPMDPEAAGFNPLLFIDEGPDFIDQCRDLANMLIVRQGTEHEPFFNDASELILTAAIAFVVACSANPEHVHLGTVRMLVSSPEDFEEALSMMQSNENSLIAELGGQCRWFEGKERAAVLSNIQRQLAWMASEAMTANLMRNDYDPRLFKTGEEKISVFCIIPPQRMATWAGWIRMVLGSTLQILTRQGASEDKPVLFMLDEVGQLGGRFQALENAVCVLRGYGIRLFFILQSFDQLKTCYGDNASVVLDNLGTMIAFNISSLDTAKTLSERMGDRTIKFTTRSNNRGSGTSTGSTSSGESRNQSSGWGSNETQQGRRLMFPDEILRLRDTALIYHNQMPPILAERLTIFRDPEFNQGPMGRQDGVGLIAGLVAATMLAASIAFTHFLLSLPVPTFRSPYGSLGMSRFGPWPAAYDSPWEAQIYDTWQTGGYDDFPELEPLRYRGRSRR